MNARARTLHQVNTMIEAKPARMTGTTVGTESNKHVVRAVPAHQLVMMTAKRRDWESESDADEPWICRGRD